MNNNIYRINHEALKELCQEDEKAIEAIIKRQEQDKKLTKILTKYRQDVLRTIKNTFSISYYELALDIGISESTLMRYLNGGKLLKTSLEKIRNYLGKV